MTAKRAPAHLRPATRRWWRAIVREYELGDHHLALLQLAAEAWDRGQQAREILAADPKGIVDTESKRAHPAVAIERDARLSFARLLREIGLDAEGPPAGTRPPRIGGQR